MITMVINLRGILQKTGCWNRTEIALWYLKMGVEPEKRFSDRRTANSEISDERRRVVVILLRVLAGQVSNMISTWTSDTFPELQLQASIPIDVRVPALYPLVVVSVTACGPGG